MDLVSHMRQTFLSTPFPMGSQVTLRYPPWSGCPAGGVGVLPVQFERPACADAIRQRAFSASLAGSWEREKHTTPSVPQRACQLWGGNTEPEFAKKSNLLLWVAYVPCSSAQGWRRSPPQAQPGCAGLLRPRRAAGGTAARLCLS